MSDPPRRRNPTSGECLEFFDCIMSCLTEELANDTEPRVIGETGGWLSFSFGFFPKILDRVRSLSSQIRAESNLHGSETLSTQSV